MPVRKFRSIEEMKAEARWYEPGSDALYQAIAELWRASAAMYPARFPPGVYKHRSFEEAERLAEQWDEENFRRHQERLRSGSTHD